MVILVAHELGHYFPARWHGMKFMLPYFLPMPFALGSEVVTGQVELEAAPRGMKIDSERLLEAA